MQEAEWSPQLSQLISEGLYWELSWKNECRTKLIKTTLSSQEKVQMGIKS